MTNRRRSVPNRGLARSWDIECLQERAIFSGRIKIQPYRTLPGSRRGDGCGAMYVPLMVEKVHMRGTQDLFLVTRIDWSGEKARLISLKPATDLAIDVSFADILPIRRLERPAESRLD